MRNIFHKKSYTEYGGETSPISFSKKIIIEYISCEILHRLFLLYVQVKD